MLVRLLSVGAVVTAAAVVAVPGASAATLTAIVKVEQGKVELVRAGGQTQTVKGIFELGVGETVRTSGGGLASIIVNAGKVRKGAIAVGPGTTLEWGGTTAAAFTQRSGSAGYSLRQGIAGRVGSTKVEARTEGDFKAGTTVIKTVSFTAAVKGAATQLLVGSGVVAASNADGARKQTVLVKAGFSTLQQGTAPPQRPIQKTLRPCPPVLTLKSAHASGRFHCPSIFGLPAGTSDDGGNEGQSEDGFAGRWTGTYSARWVHTDANGTCNVPYGGNASAQIRQTGADIVLNLTFHNSPGVFNAAPACRLSDHRDVTYTCTGKSSGRSNANLECTHEGFKWGAKLTLAGNTITGSFDTEGDFKFDLKRS